MAEPTDSFQLRIAPETADIIRPQPQLIIHDPDLRRFVTNARADLQAAARFFEEVQTYPVAVFGSARTPEGHIDARYSEYIGNLLAVQGIPPITGGGPGVMSYVPIQYLKSLASRVWQWLKRDLRTLGVNIKIPKEQSLNKAIQLSATMQEFVFRKWALYHPALAILVQAGGFGTVDELMEVWTQATRGEHKARLAGVPNSFWKTLVQVLHKVGYEERSLITADAFNRLEDQNKVREVIQSLTPDSKPEWDEPTPRIIERMDADLVSTARALDKVPKAVLVLGGRGLRADDPVMAILREASRLMTAQGQTLRVGNPQNVAMAVTAGARAAHPQATVQALSTTENEDNLNLEGIKVLARQHDYVVHKEMLTRHTTGMVVAPGGLGTLATLFSLITQIQTGKRPPMPIVLVGSSYWKPIVKVLRDMMLEYGDRQYISEHDIELFTEITDDPHVVARALAPPASALRIAA